MSRQLIDGLIILAVVVLGATHLAAQGVGRKEVRVNPAAAVTASAVHRAQGRSDGVVPAARRVRIATTAPGAQAECGISLPLCDRP